MAAPPALRSACAHGDGGAVRELLRRGESASGLYDERSGETLLFVAAQHGHSAVCDELLDGGAHAYVNKARFIDDATPLHMAAGKGHAAVVRALLRCRAVVDRADSRAGRTPLFHAASRGQLEAAQLLLGAGADANWLDQQGIVPLYAAAQNGETQVLAALLRAGAAVNGVPAQPPPGSRRRPAPAFVPLHAAAKHGHAAAARQLLRAGADPLLCTANGQTAVWIAAQHGHAELAAMLLSACAGAVGRPATDGATPLLAAAAAGHAHCCELLLRYRADPSAADERGTTPMAAALKKGRSAHVAVVTALLNAGCAAPSHEVRASVADRSMSGLLSLASSRGLVSATQRLAWAKLPMAAAVVAAGRTSGGWRAAVTPRGRRRRASNAAATRAPPRLSAALIAHVASRMHAPSIHTATRAAEVSASRTPLAYIDGSLCADVDVSGEREANDLRRVGVSEPGRGGRSAGAFAERRDSARASARPLRGAGAVAGIAGPAAASGVPPLAQDAHRLLRCATVRGQPCRPCWLCAKDGSRGASPQ